MVDIDGVPSKFSQAYPSLARYTFNPNTQILD